MTEAEEEQRGSAKSPPRSNRNVPPGQRARSAFVALLPVLACLLGGGTSKWAEGIVVACLGLYLCISPPRHSLGWPFNAVCTGFLLCALLSFLPATWFSTPAWRNSITHLGISLSRTVTPQPWLTAECFISLLAAVSWLYLVSTQELELRAVRIQLRLFATGITGIALLSLLGYASGHSLPFWNNATGIGPFPHRAQTGDLFGIAALLLFAAGQDDIRYGRKRWIAWSIALLVMISAIFLNGSRASALILGIGGAAWIAAVSLPRALARWLFWFVAGILFLLGAAAVVRPEVLSHFQLPASALLSVQGVFADGRELILSSAFPGVGLGNFERIFYLDHALTPADGFGHPAQSDWLRLWAEMGPLAPALAIVGALLLLRRVAPLIVGSNQRFRLAAVIGAILVSLHGLLSGSGHQVGTAYSCLLLLGLALYRPLPLRRSSALPWLFRILGLFMLAVGVSWTFAWRTLALLPGSIGVANATQLANEANRGRNFPEAIRLCTRAMEWAPLEAKLYSVRGTAEVLSNQLTQSGNDDFQRARFLEPNSFSVPLEEGFVWLKVRPDMAESAWTEALRRAGPGRADVFRDLISRTGSSRAPEVRALIKRLAFSGHDLALVYFAQLNAEEFRPTFAKFFEGDPGLETMPPDQKRELFRLWDSRGDRNALLAITSQHPEWLPYTWRIVAKSRAAAGDFRGACELMQQFDNNVRFPAPDTSQSPASLRNQVFRGSNNFTAGYSLYLKQMEAGQIDDALATVRHFTANGNVPVFFYFLEAQCWSGKGDWKQAWAAWLTFDAAKDR